MNLLKRAEPGLAYAKIGVFGGPGTGKSYTTMLMACGLAARDAQRRPVAFVDTETGLGFLLPKFEQAGIEVVSSHTGAFSDLLLIAKEAEKECSVLVVDSLTYYWEELQRAYLDKQRIKAIRGPAAWGVITGEWAAWPAWFVNAQIHCIVCGREQDIWGEREDEEGRMKLTTTGTKMKAGKFGYEPSLILQNELYHKKLQDGTEEWNIRTFVRKDRADKINGRMFEWPTFESILPHISVLNPGTKHIGIDTTRTSQELYTDMDKTRAGQRRLVEIALEEISETCKAIWPSASAADKKAKVAVMEKLFGTKSWTAIQGKPLYELQAAAEVLKTLELSATDESLLALNVTMELIDRIREEQQKPRTEAQEVFGRAVSSPPDAGETTEGNVQDATFVFSGGHTGATNPASPPDSSEVRDEEVPK